MQAADRPPLTEAAEPADDRVPRMAMIVAAFLLGALVLCAWRQTEEWPLSGWELFSRLRRADQQGWLATTGTGGVEQPIPFDRLPRSFHNAGHVMERFPALDDTARLDVCMTWALALADLRHPAVPVGDIDVYRTITHTYLDHRPPVTTRTLYFQCKVAG